MTRNRTWYLEEQVLLEAGTLSAPLQDLGSWGRGFVFQIHRFPLFLSREEPVVLIYISEFLGAIFYEMEPQGTQMDREGLQCALP